MIAALHSLRASLKTDDALNVVGNDDFWKDDPPLMLRGNGEAMRGKVDVQFRRYAPWLAKVVPEKERWTFGLAIPSR